MMKLIETIVFFYKILINDTLFLGVNFGKLVMNYPNKAQNNFLWIVLEDNNNGEIHRDTSATAVNSNVLSFKFYARKLGSMTIQGNIIKKQMSTVPIKNDSMELFIKDHIFNFSKKVYVIDTVDISPPLKPSNI